MISTLMFSSNLFCLFSHVQSNKTHPGAQVRRSTELF